VFSKLKSFVEREMFTVDHYKRISSASVNLLRWVKGMYAYAKIKKDAANIGPSIQVLGGSP
jgi:hypothetical protein